MILSKNTEIKLNGSNISYFKNKGYYGKLHEIIEIKVEDLKLNSHIKILVKCDVCGNEKLLMYQSYNNNIKKYGYYSCSRKCAQNKIEETCIYNYGCKNPFQNEQIKDKIKKTLIERYNVTHPMHSEKIKDKLKNTNLEKYGCEWVFNNDKVKEKIFQTMLERYGCEYAHQNKNSIIKFLNSYDFENGFKNAILIKKFKNTHLYYQGSYEYEFLELCETLDVLSDIKNGKCYEYLKDDINFGSRTLTDFSYKEYEIEIKSSYILEKQGGMDKLNAKRRAVENSGSKYLLILDKDYSEFFILIKNSILNEKSN